MSTGSTKVSFNNDQPLQSLSLSPSKNEVALACREHVRVLHLSPTSFSDSLSLQLEFRSHNFTLTDVAWSPRDPLLIGASATNGAVVLFNVNEKRQIWSTGEATRSVNKICWHPLEDNTFASCNQDGTVKIWDYRIKKDPCQTTFTSRTDPCRDVKFNFHNSSILAAIYENGSIIIWDKRKFDHNILTKINAHTSCGLTLAWNRFDGNILASGGRDKSVKIWDLSKSSELQGEVSYQLPSHVLHTSTSVHQVIWRPSEKYSNQLATASGSDGDISIWDISSMSSIPICVLKGHNDACMAFDWLDTPIVPTATTKTPSSTTSTDSSPMNASSIKGSNESSMKRGAVSNQLKTTQQQQQMNKTSSPSSSASSSSRRAGMGWWQHTVSVGKEGSVLVQDLRYAHFPRQHMSQQAIALSPRGHLAIQWGHVSRGDPLGLKELKYTNEMNSHWYSGNLSSRLLAATAGITDYSSSTTREEHLRKNISSSSAANNGNTNDTTTTATVAAMSGLIVDGIHSHSHSRSHSIESGNKMIYDDGDTSDSAFKSLHQQSQANSDSNLPWTKPLSGVLFIANGSECGASDPCTMNILAQSYYWYPPVRRQTGTGTGTEGGQREVVKEGEEIHGAEFICSQNMSIAENLGLQWQIHEAYTSYWEILHKLQLTELACLLALHADIKLLSDRSQQGVEMRQNCGKCGKELTRAENSTGVKLPWCVRCKACVGLCVVCHRPVCGLMLWCPVCGHGGHKLCMNKWFEEYVLTNTNTTERNDLVCRTVESINTPNNSDNHSNTVQNSNSVHKGNKIISTVINNENRMKINVKNIRKHLLQPVSLRDSGVSTQRFNFTTVESEKLSKFIQASKPTPRRIELARLEMKICTEEIEGNDDVKLISRNCTIRQTVEYISDLLAIINKNSDYSALEAKCLVMTGTVSSALKLIFKIRNQRDINCHIEVLNAIYFGVFGAITKDIVCDGRIGGITSPGGDDSWNGQKIDRTF
eukprot:gene4728-9389_t